MRQAGMGAERQRKKAPYSLSGEQVPQTCGFQTERPSLCCSEPPSRGPLLWPFQGTDRPDGTGGGISPGDQPKGRANRLERTLRRRWPRPGHSLHPCTAAVRPRPAASSAWSRGAHPTLSPLLSAQRGSGRVRNAALRWIPAQHKKEHLNQVVIRTHAATWVNPEDIMLREMSQTQRTNTV